MKVFVAGMIALCFQASALAQIYESEDSQGVTEFSDTPTEGAQVIKVPEANVMQAPPEPIVPASPEAAPEAASAAQSAAPDDGLSDDDEPDIIYHGEHDNNRHKRHPLKEQIEDKLPGTDGPGAHVEPRPAKAAVQGGGRPSPR